MENMKKDEVGMLMKETGMSVMMASINNILSFLAGTLLPIPALRSFCAQVSFSLHRLNLIFDIKIVSKQGQSYVMRVFQAKINNSGSKPIMFLLDSAAFHCRVWFHFSLRFF